MQGPDHDDLETLTQEECRLLLDESHIGRLGLSVRALPVVLPVNFAMMDGDAIVRTGAGTKLHAALANSIVAFEVDAVDPVYQAGWSVVVQGRASEICDAGDLERARRLPLQPWATGARDHFIRIRTDVVSGRRISLDGAANGRAQAQLGSMREAP